jgi:hypothetical protein
MAGDWQFTDNERSILKRILAFVAGMALALAAGCTHSDDSTDDNLPTTAAPVESTGVETTRAPPQDEASYTTQSQAPTVVITSVSDTGAGTLRDALENAQDHDIIVFDPAVFPPNAPARIVINSELPHIRASNLTLDASNAGVILDGRQLPDNGWIAGIQLVSSEATRIMGLQISHFPGPGIAVSRDARMNVIGGDREVGEGPFGQGNLITDNAIGIDLSTSGTTLNTVTGNLIGIDNQASDTVGNDRDGIFIGEGASDNTIGPDNVIANNGDRGIRDDMAEGSGNTTTGNSVYDNGVGKGKLAPPTLFKYDVAAGIAVGATCVHCTVELYSTTDSGGEVLEGSETADELGVFAFHKTGGFAGPFLTATTTDVDFYTSDFSLATRTPQEDFSLQNGYELPRVQFLSGHSRELVDNRFSTQFDSFGTGEQRYDLGVYQSGVTRARIAIAGLEPELVDWDIPEFSISPAHDEVFDRMAANGLTLTYVLVFWDKATYPGGDGAPCNRFKTEGEVERYLEFVWFIVNHFKDRVKYFEIWNEPDIPNYCPKSIELADYINLVKRAVPVIREASSEAKIVVGAVSNTKFEPDYLLDLVASDIMPLVDVVSWHPMYGTSPEYEIYRDYYYAYPDFVQLIKDTAEANGFVGGYRVDELSWNTVDTVSESQPWVYTRLASNKYFARAAVMHLGLDIDVGIGASYYVMGNLSTVMAGAEPSRLPIEIQSSSEDVVHYSFTLPDGDHLIALWTDGVAASDEIVSTEVTLSITGLTASGSVGIDPFLSLQQEVVNETENGAFVIRDLLVRDYPVLMRLIDPKS